MSKLSERQKRFVDEYLLDLNAEQAAIRAGYSKAYARGNAHKLVANSCIRKMLKEKIEEKDKSLIASQDEILKYFTNVCRGTSESEQVVMKGTGNGFTEPVTIKVKPSEKDRLRAAENLAKYYNLFTEKVEVNADLDLNIKVDYGDEE